MNRRSFLALATIAVALREVPEAARPTPPGLVEMVDYGPTFDGVIGTTYEAWAPRYSFEFSGPLHLSKSVHGVLVGLRE